MLLSTSFTIEKERKVEKFVEPIEEEEEEVERKGREGRIVGSESDQLREIIGEVESDRS